MVDCKENYKFDLGFKRLGKICAWNTILSVPQWLKLKEKKLETSLQTSYHQRDRQY